MMRHRILPLLSIVCLLALGGLGCRAESEPAADETSTEAAVPEPAECGPQSPRDISRPEGTNSVPVPDGETPNLCNVHFHEPIEHAGFSETPEVEAAPGDPVCESVETGDEVEFHWVYTNCELAETPEEGLDNCVCDRDDLVLRVYAQAYVVGAEGVAPSQPESDLVGYAGSTTGPSYDDETCSPARVNWEVAQDVEVVGKEALGAWCDDNPWIDENRPHESRALVTDPAWLSPI